MTADDNEAELQRAHLLRLVDSWFADHFHGAPQMRDTDAYNHVRRAVDDLRRRLSEED